MENDCVVYKLSLEKEIDESYFDSIIGKTSSSLKDQIRFVRLQDDGPLLSKMKQVGKLNDKKRKKARKGGEDLFLQVQSLLHLFSVPVYCSPLHMCVDSCKGENKSHILLESIGAIKELCFQERLFFYLSKSDKKEKMMQDRGKFIERIASFARIEGGFHNVMQMADGVDRNTAYIKENFYNCLNVIRILEFTIMEYLGLEEKHQQCYSTYGSAVVPSSANVRKYCWQQCQKVSSVSRRL